MLGDIERCVLKGRFAGGGETRSVFTAEQTTGSGIGQPSWQSYLDSMFTTSIKAFISTVWQAYSYELYKRDAPPYPKGVTWTPLGEWPYSQVGTATDDALPQQVAGVAVAKTAAKRKFGRKFIAGITEGSNVQGLLTSGALTLMGQILLAYISPFGVGTSDEFEPGVVDKYGAFYPFIGGVVDTIFGTNRRRKQNVGV